MWQNYEQCNQCSKCINSNNPSGSIDTDIELCKFYLSYPFSNNIYTSNFM